MEFLNFTQKNGTAGFLEFDVTKTNISLVGPEINPLFDPETFSYELACAYAISGQYGFLPRLLYYFLLMVSLFLRKHNWLSAGALAGAMTYSASACVHAFALLLKYDFNIDIGSDDSVRFSRSPRYFGDADLTAIFPILVAGCIMLAPILNWSTMIRKHHAQAVVLYWGLLMFLALLFTLPPSVRGVQPYLLKKLSTCLIDHSLGCTYENVISGDGLLRISLDFYHRCRCNDTCGTVTVSDAPFRTNTNLQAYLVNQRVVGFLLNSSFNYLRGFSLVFLTFIIWQGILGLIAIQCGQRETRNWIFRRFGGRTLYSNRDTFSLKCRYYIGKVMAGAFYSFAIFVTCISPFLFVCSIIVNEIVVWAYPVTESYDAIGQWSIWVIAGFITLASIIQRYNSAWAKSAKLSYYATNRLIKRVLAKGTTRALPPFETQKQPKSVQEDTRNFSTKCRRPFQHMWGSIAEFWNRVLDEWQDFQRWRNDPVAASYQERKSPSGSDFEDNRLLRRESRETEMAAYQGAEAHTVFRMEESSTWGSCTSSNEPKVEKPLGSMSR